jgi:Flp pilus assembly protein TadG
MKHTRMLLTAKAKLSYQQGNVLVLFVISLNVLLLMASLALDGGHLLLNKGRLQNLVDAAALYAAKKLDDGETRAQAMAAARDLLTNNLDHSDMHELKQAINLDAHLRFEFSQTADPFLSVASPTAKYVKIVLLQVALPNFLSQIMSLNKQVSASALAGPADGQPAPYNLVLYHVPNSKDS